MWSSLALFAVLLGPAVEGKPKVELNWSAPSECPDQEAVRVAIGRLLADSATPSTAIRADAQIAGQDGQYEVQLKIEQGASVGRRSLTVSTCAEAVDVAALFVAMAIDPTIVPPPVPEPDRAEPATNGAEAEEAESTAVPEPDADPSEPTEPAPNGSEAHEPASGLREPLPTRWDGRRIRGLGLLRVGASIALVPGWSGFLQLGGGVAWRRIEVHAVASGWLPRTKTAATGGVTGRVQLWTGSVEGCPVLRPHASVAIPLCVGLHAGAMIGRGIAGVQGRRATQPWVGLSVDPGVRWRVHRWVSLRAGPHLFVSLVQPAFDTDQGTLVHRADPVGGAFTAGLMVGAQPP